METAKWTTREKVEAGEIPLNAFPIDVSMRGRAMSMFDPRYPHGSIPLPDVGGATKGLASDTVQGVWETLAIIDGKLDPSYLHGIPTKSRVVPGCNFSFDKREIPWDEGRNYIFIPTYIYMYENRIPQELKVAFYNMTRCDIALYFYDDSSNPDPTQFRKDFSHAFLVQWLLNRDFKKLMVTDNKISTMMNFSNVVDFDMNDMASGKWKDLF